MTIRVDVLFDPFDGDWAGLREGALAAEAVGLDGVLLWDHLAGSVHGASHVLECWTSLTAIAATVPRITVGPMVLNVANRDAGTLAVMAATLQEVSDGRLLLGLGAGGGRDTAYAREQTALGRRVAGDVRRRAAVERAVAQLREVWTGRAGGVSGFLTPQPHPPIVVGAFGPKVAALAGRIADGINLPGGGALPSLLQVARDAHADAGRDPADFLVTASADPSPHTVERLTEIGVHRVITLVRPPYAAGVERVAAARG